MTFQKSLLYLWLLFSYCINYAQSKNEQLLAWDQRNDSLKVLIVSKQKELIYIQQEQALQLENQRVIEKKTNNYLADLKAVQQKIDSQQINVQIKKEALLLLKQLVVKEDSLSFYMFPISDVCYKDEKITVIQYDKEKSMLTYVSGGLWECVLDLKSWTYINSEEIEFQRYKLQQEWGCQVEIAYLYDLLVLKEEMKEVGLPTSIIQNGVIYVKEGTLTMDNVYDYKKFETLKPNNKSGYVFFLKTIQL
jgi:hypothetical protein